MDEPCVLTIEVEHPDRCHAADCKVPALTDILLMVPTDMYGGRKFEQRVCLGHLMALRTLVDKLARFVPVQMMTPADVARMRMRPGVVFNMTGTTTSTNTAWSGANTYAFFYRS